MPDGRPFEDVEGFRELILANPENVARCVAEKLLVYGRGSAPTFADRVEIDAMVDRAAKKGLGLRTLIHEIVQSDAFLER